MPTFKRKLTKGLTLIELIIVITIIAFLALLILFMTKKPLFKGNDARRKGDIKNLQTAVEEYQNDNNCYPTSTVVTCQPGNGLKPYISAIPCDPVTKASYFYDYDSEHPTCPKWYRIYAKLEVADSAGYYSGDYNYYAGSANAPDPSLFSKSSFYGCRSGACVPILWDPTRPGPECDPNSRSRNCDGICGRPQAECIDWSR